MTDLATHEIVELSLGPESKWVRTGAVLPDGTLLLATRGEVIDGGIVPGQLFLLDAEGSRHVIAVNDLPSQYEVNRSGYITGVYCSDEYLTVDILFYVDEFEAVTRSYRVPVTDPTAAALRWEVTGAPQPTRYSPDGANVIFTEWYVDPVYGPILSLRDATTGALAELPNLRSFEAQFDNGTATHIPVALTWLEDGRLLYEYNSEGTFQGRPGEFQLAIDILSGQTEPVSPPFVDGCRFGDTSVVGTEEGASIQRLDGSPLLDYAAAGWILFTC